jgi:hypothetical protein
MKHHRDYASPSLHWINIRLNESLTDEQYTWLCQHDGGEFYIHNFQHAVKFERSEDAEWFVLRWL